MIWRRTSIVLVVLLLVLGHLSVWASSCEPARGGRVGGAIASRPLHVPAQPRRPAAATNEPPDGSAESTLRRAALWETPAPRFPRVPGGRLRLGALDEEWLVASPPPAADTLLEPVLLELQLGDLAARTVLAFRVGDNALVPLTQFFEMAEIRASLSPAGRLEATLQPGNVPLVVDVRADTAVSGRRRVAIDPALRVFHEGELYLSTEALGRLLGLSIFVSWPDLEVVVRDPSDLPLAMRLRREAARDAFHRGGPDGLTGPVLAGTRAPWDGFVLDYSWLSPSSDPVGGGAYAAALGANLLGGSLELGVMSEGPADAGRARVEASWLGVWRENRYVKQLRLGDRAHTGPHALAVQGAAITNAPFVRPSLIGTVPYETRLPLGWELEAYRGGELVAFDSVGDGGRFAMQLPVRYGENPVHFVAYGPFGEIREFDQTYRVASTLLPAGQFEYGVSGGRCRDFRCDATANLDLRYGLSRRYTVQAGVDRFWRNDDGDVSHPYFGLTASVTNAWALHAEAVAGAMVRTGVRYEPSLDLRLTADYTRYDDEAAAPVFYPAGRRAQWDIYGLVRPLSRDDRFFIEARANRMVSAAGTMDRARLGMSMQIGASRLLPYLRVERNTLSAAADQRSFVGLNSFLLPRAEWGPWLRRMLFRASFEVGTDGEPTLAAFDVARPLAPGVRLETGINWIRGSSGPNFTLTLSSFLPSFRSFTRVAAPSRGPASASQLIQGSVLYDRANGTLSLAAGPSLQQAGVAGHVFLDENGNGLRDVDEPGLPNVRIRIGMSSTTSDSTGAYRLWDLVPFEPVAVSVDSLSFESPLWISMLRFGALVPRPHSFTILDVPIAIGGVIEGRVVRSFGGDTHAVGGVTLLLRGRTSGEVRELTTFSDGAFYTLGVPPGDYELLVEPRMLELLGLASEPVHLTVPPSGATAGLENVEIVLTQP